jgi:DNA-binding MarR family transcriptional regulator
MKAQNLAAPLPSASDRRSERAIDMSVFVPAMLTNLAQKITTTASATYRPQFGVGITDWRIMALLAAEPWIAPVRICEATGLDKAAVSRSLRDLMDAGLAEALDDGIAQRRLPVALTLKGLAVHDEIVAYALAREERLLSGFSPEERAHLRALINRLQQSFDALQAHGD